MKRLLLDQGLAPLAAHILRQQGFDAVHVAGIGMDRAEDVEILQSARNELRVCVTLDRDFHAHLAATGHGHPSVILLRIQGLNAMGPPLRVLRLYIQMRYEWDEKKSRLNQKKHGISFEMAALAFEVQCCLVRPDRVDETGEQRWHAIGAARLSPDAAVVLFVVRVYREEIDGEEITRIISPRRANKDDLRRYQEQEMD